MSGDTRDMRLPAGCIGAHALRELALALERLETWHRSLTGARNDRPCLRRIESDGGRIRAYVTTGDDATGQHVTLELTPGGWALTDNVA